ncbi:hypothetical protein pEaSNUABM50_00556 [Erwinia phage pEa_SNUABM_50]|uniref:Uncharacterized protein n=2 Tax=Eneladusvirus BF TaxID=2560751 RepID=A0A7L8ZPW3_9CAUD|nr:hypothetical protein pEaSNUABM12_00500 [Erwinia phage pEa_SNUABM_12]QOI72546.1 hypothetical protein pEaSNUABM50_00556 [Erwinia phage pEa_SNUABM_50]
MIKLILNSTKLSDLTSDQLKFLDWKALSRDDVTESDNEFVVANLNKFSTNLKKHLITSGRINSSAMDHDQWIAFIQEHSYYSSDIDVFKHVQLPYSVVNQLLTDTSHRYRSRIVSTQSCVPIEVAIEQVSATEMNDILFSNSNPAIVDFIQTPEGAEAVKKRGKSFLNSLRYLTSAEGERLGVRVRNHTISVEVLRRANACDDGCNYARRILKELDLPSIKWDDAVLRIRNSSKLQGRQALRSYIQWIVESRDRVESAAARVEAQG